MNIVHNVEQVACTALTNMFLTLTNLPSENKRPTLWNQSFVDRLILSNPPKIPENLHSNSTLKCGFMYSDLAKWRILPATLQTYGGEVVVKFTLKINCQLFHFETVPAQQASAGWIRSARIELFPKNFLLMITKYYRTFSTFTSTQATAHELLADLGEESGYEI